MNASSRKACCISFACAAALGLTGCVAGTEAESPGGALATSEVVEPQFPTDFRRTTLIVRDAEASLALYRDVLGMEVSYDLMSEMTGKAVPAGNAGDKARFILLKTNDPWTGLLGLLHWTDPELPDPGPYDTEIGPGDEVLIFRSDNIDERCEAVSRVEGVTMHSEAHLHVYASRNNSGEIPLRFCTFFDPDGNVIELSELVSVD